MTTAYLRRLARMKDDCPGIERLRLLPRSAASRPETLPLKRQSANILPMDNAAKPQRAGRYRWWVWVLLALPYAGLCFPQVYARSTPELLGMPFFYWYQFAWVVVTSLLLGVVYRQLKSR